MLRHRLPNRQVGAGKNTVVMEGPRVKAKWLEERSSNPLPADATEVLVQQYAQFYILGMLGSMLFMLLEVNFDKFVIELYLLLISSMLVKFLEN